MSHMADLQVWFSRIDAVEARLRALATPTEGLTGPDPTTGEQWEAGQVWGHITEFIPFWVEQAGDVIDAYQGEPVAFGRTRSDPTRLAGIEQGRHVSIATMWQEVRADIADLRLFLAALPEGWAHSVGLHSSLGPIPTEQIINNFLVGHLEEHAEQLEGLAHSAPDGS